MKYLFFWRDQFLRDYKTRHKILVIIISYIEGLGGIDNLVRMDVAIPFNTIANWDKSNIENARAINYLVSSEYLTLSTKDSKQYLLLTQKALDAFNSEYFLTEHESQLRQRNYNRWQIICAVIVAFGVVYSIWKDDFKCNPSPKDKVEQK
jgi:hypothetical protein